MSPNTRLIGIIFLACTVPMSLRLIWEMTRLTWQRGPQMVGFSMAHVFPLVLVVGAAAWLGLATWVVFATIGPFRKQTSKWADSLLIGASIFTCASTFIPQPAWSTATEFVLGVSPQAPNLLVDAARQGQFARVRYLLDRGISPNSWDRQGCSVLAAAAGSKSPATVRLLLYHHADPNCFCAETPALLQAVKTGDLGTVKLLIASGANPTARDKQGFTAYDQALFSENKELIHYLEPQGITQ